MVLFKSKRKKLQLQIRESIMLQSNAHGGLVQFNIESNKPIPPAQHGTVCLQGKIR